jgi:hypothetical protein
MKTRTLLIAAVMFLGLSAVAFSQAAVYAVSSTPITTVIATGNAEPVGDITFTQTGGTTVTGPQGTITIQYGGNNVNITSVFTQAIIGNCTGGYAGNCPQVLITSSIYSPGLLVISIPAGVTTGTFTVTGVRVQINGAGLTSLAANISATGNQIAAGSTTVTVINSTIGAGIAPASVASYNNNTVPLASLTTTGNATYNAVTGQLVTGSVGTTVIKVGEGFLGAWSKNVGVRITVSATPPKGVTFTFPTTATSYDTSTTANTPINSWVRGISTSTTAQTGTGVISSSSTSSSSLQMYYYVATDIGSTTVETLEIPVAVAVDTATASFPLPSNIFTYTVSLAPVQGPYNTSGSNAGNPSGLLAPRFAALEVGPANLATIQGSSTALLIPYAFASKTALQFNTAMAIANTTEDPGTAVLGFTGATPNTGAVTFYLFPQDASGPFSYKTVAGSPGTGLDSNGNVVSGGTYAVFLNQITPLAKDASGNVYAASDFAGYVIIVTGFTNGHGIFVISNFTTLTAQSSLMLVLGARNTFPELVTF